MLKTCPIKNSKCYVDKEIPRKEAKKAKATLRLCLLVSLRETKAKCLN